jgi:replicative DNA helicase
MNRYSGNGKGNLGVFLAGWDGTRYLSDRAGGGHKEIARATMVMALMAQPRVAYDVLRDPEKVGRGLPQRFLWSWPETVVGSRPIDRPSVPEDIQWDWHQLVRGVATQAHETSEPVVIALTDEARRVFDAWRETHEPRLARDGGELGAIAEWGAKLPGQVGRLALVLHVAERGDLGGKIGGETMRAAVALGDYFVSHALYTFGVAGTDDATGDAESVLRWLRRRGGTTVTTRDVEHSRSWPASRSRSAIERLAEYGYLRQADADSRIGRPSEIWEVHPHMDRKYPTETDKTRFCRVLSGGPCSAGADRG